MNCATCDARQAPLRPWVSRGAGGATSFTFYSWPFTDVEGGYGSMCPCRTCAGPVLSSEHCPRVKREVNRRARLTGRCQPFTGSTARERPLEPTILPKVICRRGMMVPFARWCYITAAHLPRRSAQAPHSCLRDRLC